MVCADRLFGRTWTANCTGGALRGTHVVRRCGPDRAAAGRDSTPEPTDSRGSAGGSAAESAAAGIIDICREHLAMRNPTLVVLTDRNDLDDQLFSQFQRCHELLNQMPVQARDREYLRELLKMSSGGVIFTTIQKFMPEKGEKMLSLSDRRNIVVKR